GLFLDGDDRHLQAQLAGGFQRQQREAAVAGDEAVACHFTTPRSLLRMNSRSSSTSAHGGTSARMRSMAWLVLSWARVSRRREVCSASITGPPNPRRSRPMRLAPKTPISRLPTVVEYGSTSCITTL